MLVLCGFVGLANANVLMGNAPIKRGRLPIPFLFERFRPSVIILTFPFMLRYFLPLVHLYLSPLI
jgi:hypothetical protein